MTLPNPSADAGEGEGLLPLKRSAPLRLLASALAELSDIVIVTESAVDEPGPRIVYVNAAFERRMGYTADEAIGRSPRFLQGPATAREPLDRIRRALSAHRPVRETLVNYTKTGEIIHLELEIVPVFDDDGRCTHFVSIERNVSEQRAAEAALRLSEERFRIVSKATNDAVWDWDLATDVVVWGEGFGEIFGTGVSDAPVLMEHVAARVHEDDRERVLGELDLAMSHGDPAWHSVFRFRHETGEYLWVSGRGYIIRHEDGTARRMIGAMTDISSRRAVEEQLSLLATALEAVGSPVLIMRLDASVRWVNRAFTEMTGYSWDEAVGQHIASILLPPSVGTPAYGALWRTLLRGDTWSGERVSERKDGSEYPSHVTIAPVRDPDGQIRHFVGLVRDLSESRRQEAHQMRTQRIENIGMLAGGIAHDLNNVLSPILLSIEYLRATESDPERMEALAQMEASTKRGAGLLRRLLMFARGMDGSRVPLSVSACVQEVADIASSTFPRNISVQVDTDVRDNELHADPTQLYQVLMNLCVNARDAMPDGGTLTLRATCQVVDDVFAQMHPSAAPGRYVVLRVSDTGCGMTDGVRSKALEPFFTTKPIGQGTGLGLSTVSAIVRGHGGFLHVESVVGKGSTFSVFLPASSESTALEMASAPSVPLPRGAGETVLLVDDEASIRDVARKTLERFGYRVLAAEHGAAAVALFATHRNEIAVVVVDMLMPVLDGAATIVALKALDPAVCIVASSGAASSEYLALTARVGVNSFVQKPYSASELLTVIADCLARPARPTGVRR